MAALNSPAVSVVGAPKPVIDKLNPATVRVGSPVDVTISGERLSKTSAVKVNGVDRVPEKSEDKRVVLKLTKDDVAKAGELLISVVTPDGASPAVEPVS